MQPANRRQPKKDDEKRMTRMGKEERERKRKKGKKGKGCRPLESLLFSVFFGVCFAFPGPPGQWFVWRCAWSNTHTHTHSKARGPGRGHPKPAVLPFVRFLFFHLFFNFPVSDSASRFCAFLALSFAFASRSETERGGAVERVTNAV